MADDAQHVPEPELPSEPRRSPNGYILPDPLPAGLILTDLKKGRWRIGQSVGLGGFGEIYSVTLLNEDHADNNSTALEENFVVKVVSPNIFLVLTFDQDLAVKGRLP
jgi:hypothetical protein